MPEAIRKYCEFYYAEAERLAARLAPVFRFVETAQMNDRDYQAGILDFVRDSRARTYLYGRPHPSVRIRRRGIGGCRQSAPRIGARLRPCSAMVTFSVIIGTRNRPSQFREALRSVPTPDLRRH